MAKVYVGTYAKYNRGSLAGAWIDLRKCATYDDFMSKCKKVHKDESDPELMIQDTEGFPDGLSCMEWLSREDFDDVKAAMAEEEPKSEFSIVDYSERSVALIGDTKPIEKRLRMIGGKPNSNLWCGAGWIFSKKRESQLRALIEEVCQASPAAKPSGSQDAKFKQWLKDYAEAANDDYYSPKNFFGAVKVGDCFIVLDKQSIDNQFCFHDEGPGYDFYCSLVSDEGKLKEYFLKKNLGELERKIEGMEQGVPVWIYRNEKSHRASICVSKCKPGRWDDECKQLTDKQALSDILEAYRLCYESFKKRCNAYLKRYGVSKLHLWTYWADA